MYTYTYYIHDIIVVYNTCTYNRLCYDISTYNMPRGR